MKLFYFLFIVFSLNAQVGINVENPETNLDVQVVNKDFPTATSGISIPQVNILPSVGNRSGQIVYSTTSNIYYYWDGIVWRSLNINIVQDLLNTSSNNVISTQGFLNEYKKVLPRTYFENINANLNSGPSSSSSWYNRTLYQTYDTKLIRDGFDARFYFELVSRSERYCNYYGCMDWPGGRLVLFLDVYDSNNSLLGSVTLSYNQFFMNFIRYKSNIGTENKTYYISRSHPLIPDTGDFYIRFRFRFTNYRHSNLFSRLRINESRGSTDLLSSSYYELQEVPSH